MLFAEILKKVEENKKIFEECIASYGDEYAFTFEQVKAAIFDKYLQNPDACAKIEMIQSMAEDRMERGEPMNDIINMDQISKKNKGEVFTPTKLVDDMLDKLPVEVWSNKNYKWIDIAVGSGVFMWHGVIPRLMKGLSNVIPDEKERKMHIASMIYGVDIQITNVGICRPYIIKMLGIETKDIIIDHFALHDSLTFDYWGGIKFDVVVGNPPYQDEAKGKGKLGSFPLWIKFVRKSFDLLVKNGYLVYVHPSLWRQEGNDKCLVLRERNMIHLDIHGIKDGMQMFDATTRYDWYVCQNREYNGKTTVRGEDGEVVTLDIREWSFIPNMKFDVIRGLLAKDGEDKVEVLHSHSKYETRKDHMSKEKTGDFAYPCVYYIPKDKNPSFFYSNSDKGWFSVPKIIFCSGVYKSVDVINDKNGEYAMTQFCFGVVDDKKNLDSIKEAVRSQKFIDVVEAFCISKTEINKNIISLFRKDFWKDFI